MRSTSGCSVLLKLLMALTIALSVNRRPAHAVTEDTSLHLALELFKQLEPEGRNIVISPYGLRAAFALLYIGARGQTAAEIANALQLNSSADVELKEQINVLARLQEGGGKGAGQFASANGLWLQQDFKFLESYTNLIRNSLAADLKQTNFAHDAPGARRAVNGWVFEMTQGKIPELVGESALTPMTRLVLANAVYFKGYWNVPFDPKLTAPGMFRINREQKKQVPMMHLQSRLAVRIGKDSLGERFDMLELPYKGRDISMLIVMPKPELPLDKFEARVTDRDLELVRKHLQPEMVDVQLPKFKMSWGRSLVPTLQRLGMQSAFSPVADLSGIDGSRLLTLSEALHQSFIEINEEGTEAAAATAIIGALKTARKNQAVAFRVDRPFLFFIRLNSTGTILFGGRVSDIN